MITAVPAPCTTAKRAVSVKVARPKAYAWVAGIFRPKMNYIAALLEIVGAFLLAAEAIKLNNLAILRNRIKAFQQRINPTIKIVRDLTPGEEEYKPGFTLFLMFAGGTLLQTVAFLIARAKFPVAAEYMRHLL